MTTANDLIARSLRIAGALGAGETMDSDEAADGLTALNTMLDSWRIKRAMVYHIKEEEFTLVAGQSVYTIGTGGNFSTTRPDKIEYAYIRENGNDYYMEVVTVDAFKRITNKTVSSDLPDHLYYETEYPLGKIHIYPEPSQANLIYLNTWQILQSFATLTEEIALPPGYERAIVYNLAEEIAPEFGVELSAGASKIANESKQNLVRINARPVIAKIDSAITGRGDRYNIYGDV